MTTQNTAIAKATPQAVMSTNDMKEAANMIVEGKLFPQWNTVPKIMTLMLLCRAEGIDPISAIQRYDNIQGRITKKSQAILGDFIAVGGKVEWIENTPEKVTGKFTTPSEVEHTETFTMDDARRAGLVKPGSAWIKYPTAMLRARCITFALRAIFPQSLNMMLSSEEVQDMPATTRQVEENSVPTITETVQTTTPSKQIVTPSNTKPEPANEEPIVNAEVVGDTPDDIRAWLKTKDAKKVNAFLKKINWGTISKLTEANLKTIADRRDSFEEKIDAMEV